MQKIWERSIRRSGLSISYSAGFHPQARIQQACPLPLGFFSEDEIVDIWLNETQNTNQIQEKIVPFLPCGIQVKIIQQVDLNSATLQSIILAADYEVDIPKFVGIKNIRNNVNILLSTDNYEVYKENKSFNLRSRINNIEVISDSSSSCVTIRMNLSHTQNANGRPDDVLKAMELDPLVAKITRKKLYYQSQ